MTSDSPGFDEERITSIQGVSASFFSMRSVSSRFHLCGAGPGQSDVHHHHLEEGEVRIFGAPSWRKDSTPPTMKTIIG